MQILFEVESSILHWPFVLGAQFMFAFMVLTAFNNDLSHKKEATIFREMVVMDYSFAVDWAVIWKFLFEQVKGFIDKNKVNLAVC